MSSSQWEFIVRSLGLPQRYLQVLGLGWSAKAGAYTFPMKNHEGQVVGVRLRYPDGKKLSAKGSKAGLFMADKVDTDGVLLVAEGPTDTAALMTTGHQVVGRPSCNGGTNFVYQMISWRTSLVIVADNDKPGKEGAKRLAEICKCKTKSVKIIIPRKGSDAKDWLGHGLNRATLDLMIHQASPE
jgi:DNA primase|tara:strand:- start:98 stop:649 length:552 start_codon:yes stop_codon:yes gene_type:complete